MIKDATWATNVLRSGMKTVGAATRGTGKFLGSLGKPTPENGIINSIINLTSGRDKKVYSRFFNDLQHSYLMGEAKENLGKQFSRGMLTKSQYAARMASARAQHLGRGNYVQRVMRNAVEDVKHPIQNSKKFVFNIFKRYDPETNTLVNRSPLGMGATAAWEIGVPAYFVADTMKDKELDTKSKIGRGLAYTAIAPTFRRFLPSMAAYTAVDSVFKPKIKPVPVEGMNNVPTPGDISPVQ